MVSGTISLSSLECFSPFPHGTNSLSVSREYLALPDGPGRFTQNYSCSALLRDSLRLIKLRIQDYHLILLNFPEHSPHFQSTISWPYYPYHALLRHRFGLFPVRSPLLGESLLFSFPRGTKMFQFPAFAPIIKYGWLSFRQSGCPIRKSSDQRLFASTRGLSQLMTSFIASVSLGIRHTPLITFYSFYILPN